MSRIALASAGADRALWLAALALDGRIGRMVLGASEPMLGQLRLAWWRDQLDNDPVDRPRGDPLLDQIGEHWVGAEGALRALVDGWEALLGERPLREADAAAFVEGRAAMAAGLAIRLSRKEARGEAERAGRLWACADLAAAASEESENRLARSLATDILAPPLRLPRKLRPLTVMGGLARRALRRESRAMLGDRLSPLVALRLGLLGR